MCTRGCLALIGFFALVLGGSAIGAYGIMFTVVSCNSNYRNCTSKMNPMELISVGTFDCQTDCPSTPLTEYVFDYETGEVMTQTDGYVIVDINVVAQCVILSGSDTYNFNQTYYAYVETKELYGMELVTCDTNQSKLNQLFNLGIGMICLGILLLAASPVSLYMSVRFN